MAVNDPLTSLSAMIAAIEPGFRTIDGSLVRQLLLEAGFPETAAVIEPGPRLIDTTILKNLAQSIPDQPMAQNFANQMPGKRLIDGIPFKGLAIEVSLVEEPGEEESGPEDPGTGEPQAA